MSGPVRTVSGSLTHHVLNQAYAPVTIMVPATFFCLRKAEDNLSPNLESAGAGVDAKEAVGNDAGEGAGR